MNEGLAILMARITSHPTEFQNFPNGRWVDLVNIVLDEARSGGFVTPAQREEFRSELNKIRGDTFTQSVLRRLLGHGYDSSGHLLINPPSKGT